MSFLAAVTAAVVVFAAGLMVLTEQPASKKNIFKPLNTMRCTTLIQYLLLFEGIETLLSEHSLFAKHRQRRGRFCGVKHETPLSKVGKCNLYGAQHSPTHKG